MFQNMTEFPIEKRLLYQQTKFPYQMFKVMEDILISTTPRDVSYLYHTL